VAPPCTGFVVKGFVVKGRTALAVFDGTRLVDVERGCVP
jgi:hypothetical protein